MMLDMKRTFDEVVIAHSDPVRAQAILDNPFYQALSSSFAGTQEYMAMEKLGQLHRESQSEGRWNLIIVDTPPSRSALDFLDAPMRLGAFLDGRLIRILAAPARVGGRAYMRLVSASLGVFSNVLNKIVGAQVLADLQTFVASADALFGGFRERAEQTYALLAARGTAFLVIAAPEPDALREASYFVERLESEGMPLAGLVLNRVAPVRLPELSPDQAAAGAERLRADDPAADSADPDRLPARPALRPDAPVRAPAPPRRPFRRREPTGAGDCGHRLGPGRPRPRGVAQGGGPDGRTTRALTRWGHRLT